MAVINIAPFTGQLSGVPHLQVRRNMLTTQDLTFTGTSTQSAALPNTADYVRLLSDTNCRVAIGIDPTTSATNGVWLTAGVPEDIGLPHGVHPTLCKVAAQTR